MKLLLVLILAFSFFSTSANASTGDCSTWTKGYKAYSVNGNKLGCYYDGSSWHARSGTCNTRARQQARAGYRGDQVFYRIAKYNCSMDNYGVYFTPNVR